MLRRWTFGGAQAFALACELHRCTCFLQNVWSPAFHWITHCKFVPRNGKDLPPSLGLEPFHLEGTLITIYLIGDCVLPLMMDYSVILALQCDDEINYAGKSYWSASADISRHCITHPLYYNWNMVLTFMFPIFCGQHKFRDCVFVVRMLCLEEFFTLYTYFNLTAFLL